MNMAWTQTNPRVSYATPSVPNYLMTLHSQVKYIFSSGSSSTPDQLLSNAFFFSNAKEKKVYIFIFRVRKFFLGHDSDAFLLPLSPRPQHCLYRSSPLSQSSSF